MKRQYIFFPLFVLVAILLFPIATYAQKDMFHASKHYNERIKVFENEGNIPPNSIIMFGDSHVEFGGNWTHRFNVGQQIINRGIIGDDAVGMFHRLKPIIASQPKAIFFDCGTNDLSHGWPVEKVYSQIVKILSSIQMQSPQTHIYVQSLFPLCPPKGNWRLLKGKEASIVKLNKLLESYCQEHKIPFIDVYSRLLSSSPSQMREEYSRDGLHLNETGYKILVSSLQPYMDQELSR